MASRDVQDILGISADSAAKPRPKKKAKISHPRPEGISRELLALYGERAPPLPIEDRTKYKAKRSLPTVKVSWQRKRFTNQARVDGLLLSHWSQKQEPLGIQATDATPSAPVQDGTPTVDEPIPPPSFEQREPIKDSDGIEEIEYRFAKHNIQVKPPRYDPSQYDSLLKSDAWSKDETEYLLELYEDFYGKWTIIADRYGFKPAARNGDVKSSGEIQVFQDRTMEDMKARFYEVSAKLMAAHTPVSNMTASEFEDHEKRIKFDPKQETERKRQKEAILTRTKDEKKEEEYLLAELRRIYLRQKRNEEEQADLRERLDHTLTDSIPTAPSYTNSTEINNLFQKMLQKDKQQKAQRRSVYGDPGGPNAIATQAAGATATPTSATAAQGGGQKRGSTAAGATPIRRQIPANTEKRLGVTHHDRLTSGVSFRSDKLVKVRIAKSAAQTQKIATILTELQVPEILQMPTSGVVQATEKLIGKVTLLIEARRAKEKEQNDLKVAQQLKGLRAESEAKIDGKSEKKAKIEGENEGAGSDKEMGEAGAEADSARDGRGDRDTGREVEADAEGEPENDDGQGNGEDEEGENQDDDESAEDEAEGETRVEGETEMALAAAESDAEAEEEEGVEDDNEEEVEEDDNDDNEDDGNEEEIEEEEEEEEEEDDEIRMDGEDDEGAVENEDNQVDTQIDGEEEEEEEEDEEEENEDDATGQDEEDGAGIAASPPEPPTRRNVKRSASVMSAASSAGRKRQKGART